LFAEVASTALSHAEFVTCRPPLQPIDWPKGPCLWLHGGHTRGLLTSPKVLDAPLYHPQPYSWTCPLWRSQAEFVTCRPPLQPIDWPKGPCLWLHEAHTQRFVTSPKVLEAPPYHQQPYPWTCPLGEVPGCYQNLVTSLHQFETKKEGKEGPQEEE